jgi:DNA-binding NarL/FixJ family response regulator
MAIGSADAKQADALSEPAGPRPDGWRRRPHAVIVDANAMVADLLSASLASFYEIHVAARASTAGDGATACARHAPDLLIVNPELPDGPGMAVVQALVEANPVARAIVVAGGTGLSRLKRGAIMPPQVHAIVDLSAGMPAFSRELARLLAAVDRGPATLRAERILSGREFDVFRLIGRGMMNAAIAERLGIRVQTVETHRKSIAKKLQATGVELVRLAVLYVSNSGSFITSGE